MYNFRELCIELGHAPSLNFVQKSAKLTGPFPWNTKGRMVLPLHFFLYVYVFITRLRQPEGQSPNQIAPLPVQCFLSVGPGNVPNDPARD